MAGLYIHIPFCKSRCIYCGFYSTTHEELKQRYVEAVCKEMESFTPTFSTPKDNRIETIYLGGGTPSQLSAEQLNQLFIYINKVYGLEHAKEITMECNPDDLTEEYVERLAQLPINRISMGVQTFSNERLQFLHRRHTAEQIPVAVERLRKAGINNISIDLMYGFPGESLNDWHYDIQQALALDVEHLSAYCLMIEEGTPLYKQYLKNTEKFTVDEELERQMYNDLIDRLEAAGYEHYEISNFAKPGYRSRHNSSYWNQTPYIGLGAAAHSYNGKDCRRWNIDHIKTYIEGIEKGERVYEQEPIDDDTRYNDIVMTSLRTRDGICLSQLTTAQQSYCMKEAKRFLDDGLLELVAGHLRITRKGLFVSNMIMSELMIVNE